MSAICITKCKYVGELIGGILAQRGVKYQCFTDSNEAMQAIIKKEHAYLILEDDIQPVDCLTICKVNSAVLGSRRRSIIISTNRARGFLLSCINAGATKIITAEDFSLDTFMGLFEAASPVEPQPTPEARPHVALVRDEPEQICHESDQQTRNLHGEILAQVKSMQGVGQEEPLDYSPIDFCPIAKVSAEDPYVDMDHFEDVFGSIEPLTEQVIAAARREDVHIREISCIIKRDPYLSAMVLKQANLRKQKSARVHELGEACVVLGAAAIERIAISSAILKLFKDPICETPVSFIQKLIAKSAITSVVAERVCEILKMSRLSTSRVCQAALMSDLGRIVLYESQPVHYADLVDYMETTGVCPELLEMAIIGSHHRFYSTQVAERWGMDRGVCDLICCSRRRYDTCHQANGKEAYCLILARDIVNCALPIGLQSDSFYEHGVDLVKAGVPAEALAALYAEIPQIADMVWSCLFGDASLPAWVVATDTFNQSRLTFSGPAQEANMLRRFAEAWSARTTDRDAATYDVLDLRYSPPSAANKLIAEQREAGGSKGIIAVLRHGKLLKGVADSIEADASVQVVQAPLSWRQAQLAIERINASAGARGVGGAQSSRSGPSGRA